MNMKQLKDYRDVVNKKYSTMIMEELFTELFERLSTDVYSIDMEIMSRSVNESLVNEVKKRLAEKGVVIEAKYL